MRIVRSSPWLSSLSVLNVLVVAAGALALAIPRAMSTSDITLGVLVIAYLVVLWYFRARHPADLVEMDTLFFAFFGIYVVLPIVAFVIWQAIGDAPPFIHLIAHFESGVLTVAAAALLSFLLGYSSPIGPSFAKLMPGTDGAWSRSEGLAISWGLLLLGAALVAILVRMVGLETLTESEYARGYEATAGLGILAGGLMLVQIGLVVLYLALAGPGRRACILPWILFAVLALLMLRIGRRRVVLEIGLALVVAHHFYVRRIRFRTLAVGAVAALLVFAAVGLARTYPPKGLGGILTRLVEEFGPSEVLRLMAEPVTVLLALTETIYQVPGQEPFWMGRSFIDAFEILIPLPLHPNRPLGP
jgi:hypothetical protein